MAFFFPVAAKRGAVKPVSPVLVVGKVVLAMVVLVVLVWLLWQLWITPDTAQTDGSYQPGKTEDEAAYTAKSSDASAGNGLLAPRPPSELIEPRLPEVKPVVEPYGFYKELDKPPKERKLNPESWEKNRIYTVSSEALPTHEEALALRAQLYMAGFSKIDLKAEWVEGSKQYKLIVREIASRSKMNEVKDIFSDNEVVSEVTAIDR